MEAPSSKEEDVVEVVQLIGVDLRRSPAMLRRDGGPSMVEGRVVKLLHGFGRERVRFE